MSHHHQQIPSIPNLHGLTTSSQMYHLVIVTDGTNTAAEISADEPRSESGRTPVSHGYARRHKRDPRNNQYGEILAVQRAFAAAAERYGKMLDDFESHNRFEDALKELTGAAGKAAKQERKDVKRKAARERYRREHGHDHTDWPLT